MNHSSRVIAQWSYQGFLACLDTPPAAALGMNGWGNVRVCVNEPFAPSDRAVVVSRVFSVPRYTACGGTRHEGRSEEHTSELQSLMRISYAVFCLKKKKH